MSKAYKIKRGHKRDQYFVTVRSSGKDRDVTFHILSVHYSERSALADIKNRRRNDVE